MKFRNEKHKEVIYLDNICPYGYWEQFKQK